MLREGKVWVQIGTYDGRDAFRNLVSVFTPSQIVLVEPNEKMNKRIHKNYKGIPNYVIENSAIMEVTKGMVDLVHPADVPRKEKGHYNECFSLVPMDDWGTHFKKVTVPSLSFTDLCKKYNLTEINFLQIDAEGYDCEIIKSIDFTKVSIDVIKYENWSFSMDCYTRYGEEGQKYGVNGMAYVANLLQGLGYTLEEGKANIIAMK